MEPVNGHIKEARGFRRFSMRGAVNVRGEWSLLCTVHNFVEAGFSRPLIPTHRRAKHDWPKATEGRLEHFVLEGNRKVPT